MLTMLSIMRQFPYLRRQVIEHPNSSTHYQDHDDHHQHSLLSPLRVCGVFTIIHLKQTVFLGYIVLQLFTLCATYNAISDVFLHFFDFMLSLSVAKVFPK